MSVKISELTAAASVETTDIVPIVDLSEGQTKKATIAQLLALADPSVTLGGSNADVMVRASATSTTGVSPGATGNAGVFVQHVPGFRVQVADATAAGDAFTGALAVGLAEGMPLAQAVRFANAAGALTCMKVGAMVAIPNRIQVETLLAGS
jgi:sugar/nucleoside kinase (ribokinase family)